MPAFWSASYAVEAYEGHSSSATRSDTPGLNVRPPAGFVSTSQPASRNTCSRDFTNADGSAFAWSTTNQTLRTGPSSVRSTESIDWRCSSVKVRAADEIGWRAVSAGRPPAPWRRFVTSAFSRMM